MNYEEKLNYIQSNTGLNLKNMDDDTLKVAMDSLKNELEIQIERTLEEIREVSEEYKELLINAKEMEEKVYNE